MLNPWCAIRPSGGQPHGPAGQDKVMRATVARETQGLAAPLFLGGESGPECSLARRPAGDLFWPGAPPGLPCGGAPGREFILTDRPARNLCWWSPRPGTYFGGAAGLQYILAEHPAGRWWSARPEVCFRGAASPAFFFAEWLAGNLFWCSWA